MVMAVVMLFWFDESDFDFIVVKCGPFCLISVLWCWSVANYSRYSAF